MLCSLIASSYSELKKFLRTPVLHIIMTQATNSMPLAPLLAPKRAVINTSIITVLYMFVLC